MKPTILPTSLAGRITAVVLVSITVALVVFTLTLLVFDRANLIESLQARLATFCSVVGHELHCSNRLQRQGGGRPGAAGFAQRAPRSYPAACTTLPGSCSRNTSAAPTTLSALQALKRSHRSPKHTVPSCATSSAKMNGSALSLSPPICTTWPHANAE